MACIYLQVLSFIIMTCAAVASGAVNDFEDYSDRDTNALDYNEAGDYRAAAGWLIFVGVMGILVEGLIILLRILNITVINQNFIIFGFVVSPVLLYVCIIGYAVLMLIDIPAHSKLKVPE